LPSAPPSGSALIVSPPFFGSTIIWPSNVVVPEANNVALTGVLVPPPVTSSMSLLALRSEPKVASIAESATGPPLAAPPSVMVSPSIWPPEAISGVPAEMIALSPACGTAPLTQLLESNQLPILPDIQVVIVPVIAKP
jgi:hypothetical protein